MNFSEVLRILSLGIVNIIGIIVPGFLFVTLSIVCIVIPLFSVCIHLNNILPDIWPCFEWYSIIGVCELDKKLIVILVLIVSYVLGYVLRLGDIDHLDRKSAQHVWKIMSKEHATLQEDATKNDNWPYYPNDKYGRYPYLHTKSYLESRGLEEQAALVIWGDPSDTNKSPQRSKAIINKYKVDVLNKSPLLSGVIESNEAHIRLLFGVWQVAGIFTIFSTVSLGICILAIVGIYYNELQWCGTRSSYAIIGVVQGLLLITLLWIKTRIVHLFHYQRVRELTQILVCTNLVKSEGILER